MSGPRFPWWLEPASVLGAALLWLLGHTWRIDRRGLAAWDAELARGRRCLFALWHAQLLALTFTHRGRGVAAMISRHRDGELIARIIERLGYVTARGSSTRGGEAAMLSMLEHARQGRSLTITPDGPRGPARVFKPGAVSLASLSGLPLVPVASASPNPWVMRSWDGFRIPRPFARVVVAYGDPIEVPPGLDEAGAERWRETLERALNEVTERVRRQAGEAA